MRKVAREVLLEETARDAGRAWATACCHGLQREGRALEGGWPGTLHEARTRGGAEARKALSDRSMPALTHDELVLVARLTYDKAREWWRAQLNAAP